VQYPDELEKQELKLKELKSAQSAMDQWEREAVGRDDGSPAQAPLFEEMGEHRREARDRVHDAVDAHQKLVDSRK
jgi:hypothetical protein